MRVMYEAVRGDGKRFCGAIAARSLAEARRILEDRGLEEIRFLSEPMPDLDGIGARDQELVGPNQPLWRIMGPNAVVCGAGIAWGLYELLTGGGVVWTVGLIGLCTLCLAFVVAPNAVYRSLHEDRAQGRWRPMLRKARYLQVTSGALGQRLVRQGADFYVAQALAGMGRLPEALAAVVHHREGVPGQRQHYLGRLVCVYECGLDFDGALRAAREQVEVAPDNAAARIDLAMRYAHRLHDAARARAELAQIGAGEISETAEAFRQLVLGIVLAEEGSWSESRASLDAAHAVLAKMPRTSGTLAVVAAYRAWAKAGLGRFEDAARELDSARSTLDGDGGLTTRHIDAGIEALSRRGS